jgi:hypothetical protein
VRDCQVRVHSILPERLTQAADRVLREAAIAHRAHGDADPMRAAEEAASDPDAVALLGPYRSAHVAEVVEVTAPAGLPLLAPVATWAGVTRDDEPGCDDPARHRGTVLRMVARDTEVARRIAADVRASSRRAFVVAGEHEYGRQLDGQLRLAELPRADSARDADLVVLAGLPDGGEIGEAAATAPLPLTAFDGVQNADLGDREVRVALPYAPHGSLPVEDVMAGVERAEAAARLAAQAAPEGRRSLAAIRRLGNFDEHGDPIDPPVWLWRADACWRLEPDRPI